MRFPNKFKYGWWVALLIGVSLLLYVRRDGIISGNVQSFDTVLLAIGAALILIPFFSELTLLGVTLKQQVEETKKEIKQDIKDQVYSLRSDLHNMVNVSNRIQSQVFVNPSPPDDNQLPILEKQIKNILTDFKNELGLSPQPSRVQALMPSDDTILAFSSRYQVEREVRRIWESRIGNRPALDARPIRTPIIGRMVGDLVNADILPSAIGRSIREVYSIGSPAVHGEEPSEKQIAFLSDVVPPLVETLKNIP